MFHGLILRPRYLVAGDDSKGMLFVPTSWNVEAFQDTLLGIDITSGFAPVTFANYSEMLPDQHGVRKIVMGHETFLDLAEAQQRADMPRRQNLPFRSWVVPVIDPRL